ncbi:cytochrome c biogenesis CcdA family protein [Paenibacillus aquistagni]|uniref:Cytochrome c-type biogenesis protein n=1 Tax=Paenibacillus aquistagni TaxID=1852522 RepID=A0A1X7LI70_9BACL|nr:cytochrome c biogenesis protein CcdA [Paenibacillus aquistagni]NMM55462.1 cytochrome c biogenesis protein CcdA [Paenibacillus aquistagni]SMG52889.1 cytochrome c-type biogenesis protein [Paenibacillus aquistagni]
MNDITILFALMAGLLSFFSPCIFPLLPAYVANLTGSYAQNNKIQVSKSMLMSRSISFVLGFSVIFIALGASASFIGQLFSEYRGVLEKISGILIIIFGLQMARILNLNIFMREKHWEVKSNERSRSWNSFVLGMAFGTGWTPCVGLALSSILLLAGSSDTMYSGLLLLSFYSLGLGIPFLLLSLLITYSLGVVKKINKILPALSLVNGWIMIVMGVLLFTGQMTKISAWLASFTPFLY